MAEQAAALGTGGTSSEAGWAGPSIGELIAQLSEQSSSLVRNESQLAMAETERKAEYADVGIAMFGAAGVVALFGTGALIATAILALTGVVPGWLPVTVVLFLVAGVVAPLGRKRDSRATPATPQRTIDSLRRDVETVSGGWAP